MPMDKKHPHFDLIIYPFDAEGDTFKKTNAKYEKEITPTKSVTAHKSTKRKYFLHITIDDNNKPIIKGISKEFYDFDKPVDFFVPVSEETQTDLKKYKEIITNGTVNELNDLAFEINKHFIENKNEFPLYPVSNTHPLSTTNAKSLEETGKEFKKKSSYALIVRDLRSDMPAISDAPKLDEIEDVVAFDFINSLFLTHPCMKMSFIKRKIDEFSQEKKSDLNFWRIRVYIPKISYFITSGPWAKTWVKYGIDPRAYREMYIYQTIYISSRKKPLQIFEFPHLIERIEKDSNKFLTEFNEKNGFLTQYGVSQARKIMRDAESLENNSEFVGDDEDFDVYD